MLDTDKVVTDIELDCGCVLTHTHFIVSGIQHKDAREHIKYRYDYDIKTDKLTMRDVPNLQTNIEVKHLCYWHKSEFMGNIVGGVLKYYNEHK